jgi:hypothetical protein
MKYISIIVTIVIIIACTDQNKTITNYEPQPNGIFDDIMTVCAVVGADAVGGCGGAVAGAKIGACLGPKGAALGGVIGATICGAGASYATARALTGSVSIPPQENHPIYDNYNNNHEESGYYHNRLLLHLNDNQALLHNSDGTININEMYQLSIDFMENNGFVNCSQYIPYNIFENEVSQFLFVSSYNDIIMIAQNSSLPNKQYIVDFLNNHKDLNLSDLRIEYAGYYLLIDSFNLDPESKNELKTFAKVGEYSSYLWD